MPSIGRLAMRTARGKTFRAWPETAAAAQPWDPSHVCDYGRPIGRDLKNGSLVFWDPVHIRLNGGGPPNWEMYGQTRFGKTGFQKQLVPRGLARHAGVDSQGRPIKSRVEFHTDKSDPGVAEDAEAESEIQPIVEYYRGKMVYLAEEQGIDIFDVYYTGGRLVELLGRAYTAASQAKEASLDAHETFALAVGMYVLTKESKQEDNGAGMQVFTAQAMRSIKSDLLEPVVSGLKWSDAKDFRGASNNRLLKQYHEQLEENPNLRDRLDITSYPPNISEEVFLAAASRVASYFNAFHGAPFGMMFGGRTSMSQLIKGRLVGVEWKNVPGPARSLLHTLEWDALRIHSARGGNPSLLSHLSIQDEGAGMAQNPEWVLARAEYTRTSSQFRRTSITAAQYWSQVTQLGDAGSALRARAAEIQKALGGRIVGKLDEKDEYIQELSRTVSDQDIDFMINQFTAGCFALLVPGASPVMFYSFLTPQDRRFINSDKAIQSLAYRPTNVVDLQKQTQQFGVTYVSADEVRYIQPN